MANSRRRCRERKPVVLGLFLGFVILSDLSVPCALYNCCDAEAGSSSTAIFARQVLPKGMWHCLHLESCLCVTGERARP
jgi:hypothetical protein